MNKKILIPLLVALTLLIGFTIQSPITTKANSNVILASVEWVQAQLNPLKTQVTQLESKVAAQKLEIDSLKVAVTNLQTSAPAPAPAPTPAPAPAPIGGISTFPTTVYTTKANVTVHSGATKNYRVVDTLSSGKALTAIGKFSSSYGLWYNVNLSSTQRGWIFSGDVTTTKPSTFVPTTVVAKSSINIRSGATIQYRIVENIASGTSMKYLGSFKNSLGETWYNIQTPTGNKGWVLSTLTEVK